MKKNKQELKYQARQQLAAKFTAQDTDIWARIHNNIDTTQLLKKVVK